MNGEYSTSISKSNGSNISDRSRIRAARDRLLVAAYGIFVTAGMNLSMFAFVHLLDVARYLTGFTQELILAQPRSMFDRIAFIGMLGGSLLSLYGAIAMLRGKQYSACVAGAVTASIPFISPCVFLGIPFGIWALVILFRKDTRAAFAEANQAT
jgi:hypothetical protein